MYVYPTPKGIKRQRASRSKKVTQAELLRFMELEEATKEFNKLRSSIVDRIDAGTSVEPGEYQTFLERTVTKQLSWGGLEGHLPHALYARLKDTYVGTERRRLCILNSRGKRIR